MMLLRFNELTILLVQEDGGKKLLVLIQGRNLGTSQSDIVSVHVGGVDCTDNIQHFNSEKILVRLPRSAQLSPVSVVTKSGAEILLRAESLQCIMICLFHDLLFL